MAYVTLVDRALLTAFRKAKDLAVDITLVLSSPPVFDFATASVAREGIGELEAKAIILKERTLEDGNKSRRLLIKAEDVSLYDTIMFGEVPWKVSRTIQSNKHTTIVEVFANV